MYYTNYSSNYYTRVNITNKKNNKFILENINISLNKSTINLIKGKNGSGKTTLMDFMSCNVNTKIFQVEISTFFLLLQLHMKFYLNLISLKPVFKISKYLSTLSYGYIKIFFLKLKWASIFNTYYFDESFNGLDKYFILKLNKIFLYIKVIGSKKIQISHLNITYTNKSVIFLD